MDKSIDGQTAGTLMRVGCQIGAFLLAAISLTSTATRAADTADPNLTPPVIAATLTVAGATQAETWTCAYSIDNQPVITVYEVRGSQLFISGPVSSGYSAPWTIALNDQTALVGTFAGTFGKAVSLLSIVLDKRTGVVLTSDLSTVGPYSLPLRGTCKRTG